MIGRKIAYNTVVSAGARLIGTALALIILSLLTRYLGQISFGQYITILAFLFIFVVIADLGLYSICAREISRIGSNESKIVSNAFTLRFFAGLLVFALAPIVALFFPYSSETKLGILIGSVGFWFMSNKQVLIGIFQKYLSMDRVALAELAGRLVQLGLVIFFIRQKMGFLFIVSALVIGVLVDFSLVFLFAQKYISVRFRFDFSYWLKLVKEALPLGVATILVLIYFKLDTVMLSVMKGQIDVGIYGLSYKILENLIFFPAMFVGLMMPLMSKYALSSKEKFKEINQKTLNILLILIVPLIIGTFFLSHRIVILIGGPEFISSGGVLNILIVAVGIIFLATLFYNMIISLEKQKTLIYIYGFGAVFNILANLIVIPMYSYYGAAGATVLTEFIVTILMVAVLRKTIKKLPSFYLLSKYIFAALVMSLPLYFLSHWNLFFLITIAVLSYFGVLYLIGCFSIKDILSLTKPRS